MSEHPNRYFEDKDHAEAYAKYRIPFTAAVVDCIVRYVQDGGCELNMAVDIGCGTGHQSTTPLSRVFKHVIGVDVSQEQIRQTPYLSNVEFRVARGEDMAFLESSSVDVVSVATAIHWLDLPAFYKEVDRVLRPRGCLAVYWMHRQKLDNEEAQATVEEIAGYTTCTHVGMYSGKTMRYATREGLMQRKVARSLNVVNIDSNTSTSEYIADSVKMIWYRKEIPECPYGTWLHDTSVIITKSWTVEDFVNLTSTMSCWLRYLKANPGSTKLTELGEKLTSILHSDTEEIRATATSMEVKYLVNILLCRKPNL